MSTVKTTLWTNQVRSTSLIDLGIIAAIYLLPGLTHILPVPLYMIDPMRLLLFLTLITTNRMNSLVLAASIPFLSTLFSGHPVFPKNILISAELSLNVMVFHWIMGKKDSLLLAGTASILSAKVFYYVVKYGFITAGFLGGVLISTPLEYQLIPIIILPFMLFGLDKFTKR